MAESTKLSKQFLKNLVTRGPAASTRQRTKVSGGKVVGEVRFPAPKQKEWFHGTNDAAADSIVKSQKLYGSGNFGEGGYIASNMDAALDWTRTDPETYRDTQDPSDYPGLVKATLQPTRPYYGGGERDDWSFENTRQRLKEQGNDVWFPLKGALPSNPGSYAVILNDSAAKYSKEEIPWHASMDYEDED